MKTRAALRDLMQSLSRACPPLAYLFIPPLKLTDTVVQHGKMHRKMDRCIARYCTPQQIADGAYIRRMKRDMWSSLLVYRCPFDYYFMFDFPRFSPAARRQFVSPSELAAVSTRISTKEQRFILYDKWNAYERLREFYRRDAMKIDSGTTEEEFASFAKKHPRFIVKPRTSSGGRGVFFCDTSSDGCASLPELLEQLRGQNVILEEPIVQCEAMARLHPQSVNTVRCATFSRDGQVHFLFTFLRIGRGNNVVDNGGAGGYIALTDTDTGIVITPGTTENLERAIIHPDTGTQILGFHIPRWAEMKAFAADLARACPELPHIQWDLALTDDGWVVVEGNHRGGFVGPQLTAQRGIRDDLRPYFDL